MKFADGIKVGCFMSATLCQKGEEKRRGCCSERLGKEDENISRMVFHSEQLVYSNQKINYCADGSSTGRRVCYSASAVSFSSHPSLTFAMLWAVTLLHVQADPSSRHPQLIIQVYRREFLHNVCIIPPNGSQLYHRDGSFRVNALVLFSDGAWFESQLVRSRYFVIFLSNFTQILGQHF